MQHDEQEPDTEKLIQEKSTKWQRLISLTEKLPISSQDEAGQLMREIWELDSRIQEANVVDVFGDSLIIEQLSAHGKRIERFLWQIIMICAEEHVGRVRPQAESFLEYIGAWKKREAPTYAEARKQFESQRRELEGQPQ